MDKILEHRPDEAKITNAETEIQNYIQLLERKLRACISWRNLNEDIEKKFLAQQEELAKLRSKESYSQLYELQQVKLETLQAENKNLNSTNAELKEKILKLQNEIILLKAHEEKQPKIPVCTSASNVKVLNHVVDNNPEANSVLIKGLREEQLNAIPKINIINFARLMSIKLMDKDIVKVSKMERKFYERHNMKPNNVILIVQLQTPELKIEFLQNKEKLKLVEDLNEIEIIDYVSDEVFNLYQYAKILKSSGYAQIYWRNNCVYAKKTRSTLCEPVLIKTKNDVDALRVFKKKK